MMDLNWLTQGDGVGGKNNTAFQSDGENLCFWGERARAVTRSAI